MVADALKILGDEDQLKSSKHDGGILHHVSKQLAKKLVAQTIHLVVALKHTAGKINIAADQRIQAVAHHTFGEFAHARKIDVRLYLGMAQNAHRGLGNVDSLIADSFEIAIDSRNRQKKTEIGRHRLLQCE